MDQNSKSGPNGGTRRSRWLAWLPIPLILVTMAVLWVGDWRASYESPYVWMALDFLFSALASMFIAHLIARSCLRPRTASAGGSRRSRTKNSRSLSHDLSPAVLHMNDLTQVLRWSAHHVPHRCT